VKTSDNFGLVIGLGVGIPLFLLAALIVAIVIVLWVRNKRKARYSYDDDRYVVLRFSGVCNGGFMLYNYVLFDLWYSSIVFCFIHRGYLK